MVFGPKSRRIDPRVGTEGHQKEDTGRSTTTFGDLNDDILYDIFKYLPIKEKVKFERIDSNCKRVLNMLWSGQKVFVSCYGYFWPEDVCSHRTHQAVSTDIYIDRETDPMIKYFDRPAFKIMARCENLRALYWGGTRVSTDFGRYLAKICPNLEHLYFRDASCFERMMTTYPKKVVNNRLTCLHLGEDDEDVTEDFEDNLYDFAVDCPLLEVYFNFSIFNTPDVLDQLVPQLKEIKVNTFSNLREAVDIITKEGKKLVKLSIKEQLNKEHLEAICEKLPQIRSLEVSLNPLYMDTLNHLKNIEEISWIPGTDQNFDEKTFRLFLTKSGRTLKTINLTSCNLKSVAFAKLSQLCPRLTKFNYYSRSPLITDKAIDHISQVKTLTSICLSDTKVTKKGVEKLLDECPNLREVALVVLEVKDPILDLFVEYAKKHPKRVITLALDYGLLKHRTDQIEYIKSFDNLRICYVH